MNRWINFNCRLAVIRHFTSLKFYIGFDFFRINLPAEVAVSTSVTLVSEGKRKLGSSAPEIVPGYEVFGFMLSRMHFYLFTVEIWRSDILRSQNRQSET